MRLTVYPACCNHSESTRFLQPALWPHSSSACQNQFPTPTFFAIPVDWTGKNQRADFSKISEGSLVPAEKRIKYSKAIFWLFCDNFPSHAKTFSSIPTYGIVYRIFGLLALEDTTHKREQSEEYEIIGLRRRRKKIKGTHTISGAETSCLPLLKKIGPFLRGSNSKK